MLLDRENEAIPRRAELCLSQEPTSFVWSRIGDVFRDVWLNLLRGRPEDCYEMRSLLRMARGDRLDTLGLEVRDEAATREKSERWLSHLIELGLRPEHLCVEYGCGSLWCAEPFIRYLNAQRFVGLDVTERFYSIGCRRLRPLLDEKAVRLDLVSPFNLRYVASLAPDFVFSHRVLHHVPRRGMRRYMSNLCSLLNERTILAIEHMPRPLQGSAIRAPRYTRSDLQRHLPPGWHCQERTFGFVIMHRDQVTPP
jgi:hypothetical protein